MITYKKDPTTEKLEELELSKIRIHSNNEEHETVWVKHLSDGRFILQNDSLAFYPFPNWGFILTNEDISYVFEKEEILLHPEAFDQLVETGFINESGEIIAEPNVEEVES